MYCIMEQRKWRYLTTHNVSSVFFRNNRSHKIHLNLIHLDLHVRYFNIAFQEKMPNFAKFKNYEILAIKTSIKFHVFNFRLCQWKINSKLEYRYIIYKICFQKHYFIVGAKTSALNIKLRIFN